MKGGYSPPDNSTSAGSSLVLTQFLSLSLSCQCPTVLRINVACNSLRELRQILFNLRKNKVVGLLKTVDALFHGNRSANLELLWESGHKDGSQRMKVCHQCALSLVLVNVFSYATLFAWYLIEICLNVIWLGMEEEGVNLKSFIFYR